MALFLVTCAVVFSLLMVCKVHHSWTNRRGSNYTGAIHFSVIKRNHSEQVLSLRERYCLFRHYAGWVKSHLPVLKTDREEACWQMLGTSASTVLKSQSFFLQPIFQKVKPYSDIQKWQRKHTELVLCICRNCLFEKESLVILLRVAIEGRVNMTHSQLYFVPVHFSRNSIHTACQTWLFLISVRFSCGLFVMQTQGLVSLWLHKY